MLSANRRTVLRYAVIGGTVLALAVGAGWFFLSGDQEDRDRSPSSRLADRARGDGDVDFTPVVQAGLQTYSECLATLYRDNLRRKADFDHDEAARKYVEGWSQVIRRLPEEQQLGAINRELANYDCDPL